MRFPVPSRFDALNSIIAALRDGVMPLYNLYLVTQLGLTPIEISWVLTVVSSIGFAAQAPVGLLYDRVRSARVVLAGGLLVLACSSLLMFFARDHGLTYVLLTQALYGLASVVLNQGIPAITVAETSPRRLGGRVARNEVFAKIGNLSALSVAGLLTHTYGLRLVFVIVPLLTLPAVFLILGEDTEAPMSPRVRHSVWRGLSRDVGNLFVITFFLYLANSSALAVFEQVFAVGRVAGGATFVTWAAAATQVCITLTILSLAGLRRRRGLTFLLNATFAVIALRLLVMSLGVGVGNLLSAQILDGIIGGIVITVPMRILADLDRERFNVLATGLGAAAALGSGISGFASGYALTWLHYPSALLVYIVPAVVGASLACLFLLRTRAHSPGPAC